MQGGRSQRAPFQVVREDVESEISFFSFLVPQDSFNIGGAVQTSTVQIVTFVWLVLSRVVRLISDAIDSDSINHCLQFILILTMRASALPSDKFHATLLAPAHR